jgi:hypothetical protein
VDRLRLAGRTARIGIVRSKDRHSRSQHQLAAGVAQFELFTRGSCDNNREFLRHV